MTNAQSELAQHASQRIFAITLFAVDLAESKRFYETAFGLPARFEDADSAVFEFAGTMVNVLRLEAVPELVEPAVAAPRAAGVRAMFTIQVDDVDARAADLQAKGIILLNGPMDRPWGPRTASFCDPDGYVWEVAT